MLVNEWGDQLAPWTLQRAIRTARDKVPGLQPDFWFHDLRQYLASMLIASEIEGTSTIVKPDHYSVANAVGAASGPSLSALAIEWSSWRAVFLLGVPVLAFMLVAGPRNDGAGSLWAGSARIEMPRTQGGSTARKMEAACSRREKTALKRASGSGGGCVIPARPIARHAQGLLLEGPRCRRNDRPHGGISHT